METKEQLKHDMLQSFGQAYRAFGLNELMGHVVALLLYSADELSLDEIARQLGRSKGPVSQIMRRLNDHNLIRKIWKPGSRKDFYVIEPDVFANAFNNTFNLIKNNTKIARELKTSLVKIGDDSLNTLHRRMIEMESFYRLMEKHHQNFLDEWTAEQTKLLEENK